VKKWLKSVHIYGSYHKIKPGVPLFWTHRYITNNLILHKTQQPHQSHQSIVLLYVAGHVLVLYLSCYASQGVDPHTVISVSVLHSASDSTAPQT